MKRDFRATAESLEQRVCRAADLGFDTTSDAMWPVEVVEPTTHQAPVAYCDAFEFERDSAPTAASSNLSILSKVETIVNTTNAAFYEQADADDPLDINRDGTISPSDIDSIIYELNLQMSGSTHAEDELSTGTQDFDVSRDGQFTALDALRVINRVNFYNGLMPCNCSACLANTVLEGVSNQGSISER